VDVSEKNRERAQRWRELNRDRDRANALKWHFANHEKAKARSAAWRANNKEKHIKNARDWYLTHPLQARVARRNYEVRRRGAAGVFSRKDVNAMLAAQNRKCAYCERSLDGSGYHIDHIIPLSRGGTNYSDNLQLTCPQCNMRKRNKSHDDFVREIRKASLWQL
jgi:5-methylcytosine-specific restriction endonuclease McrA